MKNDDGQLGSRTETCQLLVQAFNIPTGSIGNNLIDATTGGSLLPPWLLSLPSQVLQAMGEEQSYRLLQQVSNNSDSVQV